MTTRSLFALVLAALLPTAAAGGPADLSALAAYPLEGGMTLGDLRGEVVAVHFWATWCAPCKEELPALQDLHRRMVLRGGRVVAISVDRDPERVERFLDRNRLDLPVFVDGPEGLARTLDLESLPCTYVLDRDGRAVFAGSGAGEPGWTRLLAAVERALDAPVTAAARNDR